MIRVLNSITRRMSHTWYMLLVLLTPLFVHAQTNAPAEASTPAEAQKIDLLDLVFKKGGVFMYVILLVSVGMVYLIVDAILITRRSKLLPEDQISTLKELGKQGKAEDAVKYCEENESPITRIIAAVLRVQKRGKAAMEESLAEHGAREVSAFRARLSYLNSIATIAPMLGLLGTVSGMIKAFSKIGSGGVQASLLANDISEALITTAGGLVVAIPAMAAFFFFRNRVNSLMVEVEDRVGEIAENFYQ